MELTALVEESFHRNFRKDEGETYIHMYSILYQMKLLMTTRIRFLSKKGKVGVNRFHIEERIEDSLIKSFTP